MLIALLIGFIVEAFGVASVSPLLGDPAQLEKIIKHQVQDPERLAQLKTLLAEMKAAGKEAAAQQAEAVKTIEQVASRQETTLLEGEEALLSFKAGQRSRLKRQVALRIRLAALTTPAEWAAIRLEAFPDKPAPATSVR